MQLRARLTLGVLFIAFAVGVVLVLLPVSSSASSSLAATRGSTSCGSIALHTAPQTDRAGCDGALRHRSSLVLNVAIAGLAFGMVDAALTFAARRRRKRHAETAS